MAIESFKKFVEAKFAAGDMASLQEIANNPLLDEERKAILKEVTTPEPVKKEKSKKSK